MVVLEKCYYQNREELLKNINEVIESYIGTYQVVISLGVSIFDKDNDQNFHAVFERADNLMYERKRELKSKGAVTIE